MTKRTPGTNARPIASVPKWNTRDPGNADLIEALRNCLLLVKLKFGNMDPTANIAIEQANAAIAKAVDHMEE